MLDWEIDGRGSEEEESEGRVLWIEGRVSRLCRLLSLCGGEVRVEERRVQEGMGGSTSTNMSTYFPLLYSAIM